MTCVSFIVELAFSVHMQLLFDQPDHKNLMVSDLGGGAMVQANQHLIIANGQAMILDPGGHKVYTKLFAQLASVVPVKDLKYIFLSHQDPDIVAALNGWLMVTEAEAYVSTLWTRFITHFGIDEYAEKRIKPIPDEGMVLDLGGVPLKILPAHFLHSPGNFQVYDPVSKILYSGDLGASVGSEASEVTDFDAHVPSMLGFHQRYMPHPRALQLWAEMVRKLDIEMIAPQHGAFFRGTAMVERFIAWAESLRCGAELLESTYAIPH